METRKWIWLIFLFVSAALYAQETIPTFQYVPSAPSGSCGGTPPIQIVYSTGAQWACASGTWTQVNGGGGGGLPSGSSVGQVPTLTSTPNTYAAQNAAPSSSIFYIASSCGGQSNCLTWVDDDSTDNCSSATTSFFNAVNSYSGPGSANVFIQGSGSGKAYKLVSCSLPLLGPSGTGGLAGSIIVNSQATIDCAQSSGPCIQMGRSCSTSSFYGNGCHDVTWRGGTIVGCLNTTTCMDVAQGMYINIIDDVNFVNTGAGNATIGNCTNFSVLWHTFIGGQEFSRNRYWGSVAGQCFTSNNDQTGGANTIIYTNNVISHAPGSSCGSIAHYDSSAHSTIANNTIYGWSSILTLASNGTGGGGFLGDGGWMIRGNNLDYSLGCSGNGGVEAEIQFNGTTNNVGPATISNNNIQSIPFISQAYGSTVSMLGWSITGNNTYVEGNYLIGGASTSCVALYGVPCYLGANPGFPTTASGGGAYTGFTVLGSGASPTWPPSASSPTFSPAAGSVSSGTTVTTSCSGGSPYISTGTTAVAGGTGIVVSSNETLYGSCQGSGYTTTGTAAYTVTGGSFSIANSGYFHGSSSGASSATLSTFGSALTAGSLIVVHQYSAAASSYSAPTDTAGNTYVDCGPGAGSFNAGEDNFECWYALNTHTTASNVVTVHAGTAVEFLSGIAFEILGAASSSPIDGGSGIGYSILQNATGGAAGSNALTATSLTPTGNGDLIVAFFASGNGAGAGTSPNAFTLVNSGWVQSSEYFTQATSAAIAATAQDSASSDTYGAVVVAIKP